MLQSKWHIMAYASRFTSVDTLAVVVNCLVFFRNTGKIALKMTRKKLATTRSHTANSSILVGQEKAPMRGGLVILQGNPRRHFQACQQQCVQYNNYWRMRKITPSRSVCSYSLCEMLLEANTKVGSHHHFVPLTRPRRVPPNWKCLSSSSSSCT